MTGLVIYFFMCPLQRAATLEWDWIAFVVARNILMYWITFGGTHHLLYVSATKDELVKKLELSRQSHHEASAALQGIKVQMARRVESHAR